MNRFRCPNLQDVDPVKSPEPQLYAVAERNLIRTLLCCMEQLDEELSVGLIDRAISEGMHLHEDIAKFAVFLASNDLKADAQGNYFGAKDKMMELGMLIAKAMQHVIASMPAIHQACGCARCQAKGKSAPQPGDVTTIMKGPGSDAIH